VFLFPIFSFGLSVLLEIERRALCFLARQVLYHLSQTLSPFAFVVCFSDRVSREVCSGLALNLDPPNSAFQVAEPTGMCHHVQRYFVYVISDFCLVIKFSNQLQWPDDNFCSLSGYACRLQLYDPTFAFRLNWTFDAMVLFLHIQAVPVLCGGYWHDILT
jgi:hypothetical protein